MAGTLIDVTDADFETKVLKGAGPVLAVFRAEWSSPCRALDPMLADMAKEYSGRLKHCPARHRHQPGNDAETGHHPDSHAPRVQGRQGRRYLDRARRQEPGGLTGQTTPVTCGMP
ncbi:thioredoxin family protein [Streptomyces noursei]